MLLYVFIVLDSTIECCLLFVLFLSTRLLATPLLYGGHGHHSSNETGSNHPRVVGSTPLRVVPLLERLHPLRYHFATVSVRDKLQTLREVLPVRLHRLLPHAADVDQGDQAGGL